VGAVRLHLADFTPPSTLRVYHDASQSEYRVQLEPGFGCLLQPRSLPEAALTLVNGPNDARIPVLGPADLLLTLDEQEIQMGLEPVLAWLRHLTLRTQDLDDALMRHRRPVVVQRLADLAAEAGNSSLGRQLDAASRRVSAHIVPPSRTGVGTRILVPPALTVQSPASASPWMDSQRMRLARQSDEVAAAFKEVDIPTFTAEVIAAHALNAKAYDAYHSTTMEGYRITPEVVDAIVAGNALPDGPTNAKDLEAAMNVQGYSHAFDRVLALASAHMSITREVVLDLHESLYRPSVEAGLMRPEDLRKWRTGPVGLAGFQHVPPNHLKLPDLMRGLEEFAVREDLTPMQRALLVHLEFVTIHPFSDGNGRIGRLLMNMALIETGHPWVTVLSDARTPFFKTIEAAQVRDETNPFIRFLKHEILGATRDLESNEKSARSRRRRGGRSSNA
jgi:Fic family protein